ncbi:MAG: hypothetical protein AAGG75_23180 [Bacteroidota bacterium]
MKDLSQVFDRRTWLNFSDKFSIFTRKENKVFMLTKLIEEGQFEKAVAELQLDAIKDYHENLLEGAYDSGSEMYYKFYKYIIENHVETSELHYQASEMMSTALNWMPNGYKIAYHHALKACELSPHDVSLKEYLLFFHDIPDQLLSDETARKVAEEILAIDSNNITAKRVLR